MNNNQAYDTTYYKTTANEATEDANRKESSPLQEEVFKYIRKNWVVSGKSIRLYWSIDLNDMHQVMQPLFDRDLVIRIPTQKQVDEYQIQNPLFILTEAEERKILIQEKVAEIQSLAGEYSRKRWELNHIYKKQKKAREELSELSKADYKVYAGLDDYEGT